MPKCNSLSESAAAAELQRHPYRRLTRSATRRKKEEQHQPLAFNNLHADGFELILSYIVPRCYIGFEGVDGFKQSFRRTVLPLLLVSRDTLAAFTDAIAWRLYNRVKGRPSLSVVPVMNFCMRMNTLAGCLREWFVVFFKSKRRTSTKTVRQYDFLPCDAVYDLLTDHSFDESIDNHTLCLFMYKEMGSVGPVMEILDDDLAYYFSDWGLSLHLQIPRKVSILNHGLLLCTVKKREQEMHALISASGTRAHFDLADYHDLCKTGSFTMVTELPSLKSSSKSLAGFCTRYNCPKTPTERSMLSVAGFCNATHQLANRVYQKFVQGVLVIPIGAADCLARMYSRFGYRLDGTRALHVLEVTAVDAQPLTRSAWQAVGEAAMVMYGPVDPEDFFY